ncbi:hypothetical protein Y1Q_0019389 [Alligator mississippiensis]|uniref:Endonuclease/exonuclease/phosphatase domain-containing protein n=1 Tax=Alligator mississippiensis TaxID=8496 RepID=A0A151MR12_ALLMI|nr:hypothetical protein Y1Q_0019389 [Alligator mississippiensis]
MSILLRSVGLTYLMKGSSAGKAGYTFFWSDHGSKAKQEVGVSFNKNCLIEKLTYLPKGMNDQLMVLRLPLLGKKCATIISTYAATMTNSDKVKNQFYDDLHSLIIAVPKSDHLILLGDLNSRIGSDCQTWDRVIEKHGIGSCNSNGLLLLRL